MNTEIAIPKIYNSKPFDFILPDALECAKPTEKRKIDRDAVKLLISNTENDDIQEDIFKNLDKYLKPNDVLVVNTSGTLKSAVEGVLDDGMKVIVHFSTQKKRTWIVELRKWTKNGNKRFYGGKINDVVALKGGGILQLNQPYYAENATENHLQLWEATLEINTSFNAYLDRYGAPIRYAYNKKNYPHSWYQTIFAKQMGSAEMPSAGRAFTPRLLEKLKDKGVEILPILLHTGVASLENNERPYEEYFEIESNTAKRLNNAKKRGSRIIAVGTTAIRAVESATDQKGKVTAQKGWTDLFINPKRGLRLIDGLITGFHEPKASHLLMLEALAGRAHLQLVYEKAIKEQYYWHEFGDLHLILPN